jgi:hypothetical protein
MVEDDRYAIDQDRFGRFQAALIRAVMFPEVEAAILLRTRCRSGRVASRP